MDNFENIKTLFLNRADVYDYYDNNNIYRYDKKTIDNKMKELKEMLSPNYADKLYMFYNENIFIIVDKKDKFKKITDFVDKFLMDNKIQRNTSNANVSNSSQIVLTNQKIFVLTFSSKKYESEHKNDIYVINMDEWSYNPLEHVYQPLYRVLTDEQKKKLLESFDIKESNIPKIDLKDKMARYFDLSVGEVLEIERNTIMNGEQKYYRIVK